MWIFGLIISVVLFFGGIGMANNGENAGLFVGLILPLIIIGLMFFFSFGKKDDQA